MENSGKRACGPREFPRQEVLGVVEASPCLGTGPQGRPSKAPFSWNVALEAFSAPSATSTVHLGSPGPKPPASGVTGAPARRNRGCCPAVAAERAWAWQYRLGPAETFPGPAVSSSFDHLNPQTSKGVVT